MTIKDGYNNKPTHISFGGEKDTIEMWIKHEGVEGKDEVMLYLTANELYGLFSSVKSRGVELFS